MPSDTATPILQSLSFETSLDLAASDRRLLITGSLADELSGASSISLQFWNVTTPYTSSQMTGFNASFVIPNPTPGTASFSFAYEVNEFIARGVYALAEVHIRDQAGNWKQLTAEEVLSVGSPVHLNLHDGPSATVTSPTFGDDYIVGSSENNYLRGFAGNDTLVSGMGFNRLDGGDGDDLLIPSSVIDFIEGGPGSDTVTWAGFTASINLTVDPNTWYNWKVQDVERFVLTNYNDRFTILQGASVAGGSGDDLIRGDGNWWRVNDPVNFSGDAGHDTLIGAEGSDRLNGDANADLIRGNAGSDRIDGGLGTDALYGGDGSDTYFVDSRSDRVVETSAGGTADRVYTSASYSLSKYVEKLYASGSSSLSLTGNTAANTIAGNTGNNKINGGAGKDSLSGGLGQDTFIFKDKLSMVGNLDTITDYSVNADTIWLDNNYMPKLGSGSDAKPKKVSASFFTVGSEAKDENDYLIYNRKTGYVSYDADGSGGGKAVEIAKIGKSLAMSSAEFYVI